VPVVAVDRSRIGLLLIDAQPLFWDEMEGRVEPVMARIEQLLLLATWLELPLIATFEHPLERKGTLPERLEQLFPDHGQRLVKRTYDCCAEPSIREAIEALEVQQFAVCGAETDVCVLQSVLGLLKMGYQVFLLEDCLFTSEPNPQPAIQRMSQAGAIPCTYKTLAYELARSVDQTPWLETGAAVAQGFPERFRSPEELPPWDVKR